MTLEYAMDAGEWVNEWSVTNATQMDYQNFGRTQLDVYNAASFGWAYWTLKNDRKHWDFEWNIRNNYLQLGKSLGSSFTLFVLKIHSHLKALIRFISYLLSCFS